MKLEKVMWSFCGPKGGLQWRIKETGWTAWEWAKKDNDVKKLLGLWKKQISETLQELQEHLIL